MKCEYCGSEHDGSYGSGRFCNASCARRFSNKFVTKSGRAKQISVLNDPENRKKNLAAILKYAEERRKNEPVESPTERDITLSQMTSSERWNLAKNATLKHFSENRVRTYLPVLESDSINMIGDFSGKLKKIKIKSVKDKPSKKTSTIYVKLKANKHRIKHGKCENYIDVCEDADLFAVYMSSLDKLKIIENNGDDAVLIDDFDEI